jgi:glycosyltransferase involved in cell wall biosynthesis
MPKVLSIAIPSYNMEEWLPRCLDSIVLPEIIDDIEIIIVNDGSTDETLSIANSYKNRFPDSIIVIDKPNGHYGSCINAALKVASGKYFRILDADDCFDSENFIKYISFLTNNNIDMIFTNYSRNYIDGKHKEAIKHSKCSLVPEHIYNINDWKKHKDCICSTKLYRMHCMTYATKVLHECNYTQTEGINYTDSEFCFYPVKFVKQFVYYNIVLYQYTVGREGQTAGPEFAYKHRNDFLILMKRMLKSRPQNTLQSVKLKEVIKEYIILVLGNMKYTVLHKR